MDRVSKIYFSEDCQTVYGVKSEFNDEDDFHSQANKAHINLTGHGCSFVSTDSDIFICSNDGLVANKLYRLKDTNTAIETLYCSRIISLDSCNGYCE